MTRRLPLVLLALAATSAITAPAHAASPSTIARDCQDGSLSQDYSPADLRKALDQLPSDVLQYTPCGQVIRSARLAAAAGTSTKTRSQNGGTGAGATGSGGGGGTAGGATGADPGAAAAPPPADADAALQAATPQQRAAVDKARTTAPAPVRVDGAQVSPSALDSGSLEDLNTLPTPLIVALLLLGLGTVAGGGAFAQHVVTRRRSA